MSLSAVVYARVSSDPKAIGRSVAEQEAECAALIEREGWRHVRTFKDNDRSASRYATKARPAYAALVQYLREGRADVLVCWEASRAQRDLEAYVQLRDICAANGVRWSYSGRTYDLGRSDDRFTTGLDALLAERESDITRDRVLRAVRANAAAGRPHGKLLYGYRREYDATSGKLLAQVEDEEQAPIVREAATRVLSGESLYAVAGDLQARSVPAPRGDRWYPETLKRVLVNPGYAGKRVHRGEVIGDADWSPILDEGEWLQLIARLNDPARRTRRDTSIKHLLSGIAKCGKGDCKNVVRVQKNRGFLAYIPVPCFHVSRRQDHVDHLVTEIVIGRLSKPDVTDLLVARDATAAAEARREAATLRARLEGFYDAAAAGEITPAALARIEAGILAQITEVERRVVAAALPAVLLGIAGRPDARGRWAALSMPQRREVITTLVQVHILPTKRGQKVFDPESVLIEWRAS